MRIRGAGLGLDIDCILLNNYQTTSSDLSSYRCVLARNLTKYVDSWELWNGLYSIAHAPKHYAHVIILREYFVEAGAHIARNIL